MTINFQSLRVVLTDLAASAALLVLDLAGRITDRRNPAPEPVVEPVEPVVETLPRQRIETLPEPDEAEAGIRLLTGVGTDEDRELVKALVRRANWLEEHADEFAEWEEGR